MKKIIALSMMLFMLVGCTTQPVIDNTTPEDTTNQTDTPTEDDVDWTVENIDKIFLNYESYAEYPKGKIVVIAGKNNNQEELNDYLFDELHVGYTPTFIIFNDEGKIKYFSDGELDLERFNKIVKDIEGENLVCFEIVSTTCTHCKNQIEKYMPAIVENNQDIAFIEYFIIDTKEDIEKFYTGSTASE